MTLLRWTAAGLLLASLAAGAKRGAWVPVLALAEATWVLASVRGPDAASLATAIEMLRNHKDLTL